MSRKSQIVAEHRAFTSGIFWFELGPPGLIGLLALPVGLVAAWRDNRHRFALAALLAGAMITALSLRTYDYDYMPPAFFAMMAMWLVCRFFAGLLANWSIGERAMMGSVLTVAAVLPLWPLGWVQVFWPREIEGITTFINDGWADATRWMKAHTPAPAISVGAPVEPWAGEGFDYPPGTYGVYTPWEYGNFVNALAGRHAVWSRYPVAQSAAWLVSENEAESLDLICPGCGPGDQVRYSVLDARVVADQYPGKTLTAGIEIPRKMEGIWTLGEGMQIIKWSYGDRYNNCMATRLHMHMHDGVELSHYRLVYESPQENYVTYVTHQGGFNRAAVRVLDTEHRAYLLKQIEQGGVMLALDGYAYDGRLVSAVKVFEVVKGATIVAAAPPQAKAEARLTLAAGATGRTFEYVRSAVADDAGRIELTVPYPSANPATHTDVLADGPYLLQYFDDEANATEIGRVNVTGEQIRQGALIKLPR